jgi:GT2 family glycosyltransferase
MNTGPAIDRLSVVVPCYNADQDLEQCLEALRTDGGEALDILVVDDASTRGDPAAIADRYGARYLRLPDNAGPAVARNAGVAASDSPGILFIDADVRVHPGTVAKALAALREATDVGACFGSYDQAPDDPGFFSQFRNLLHRWVHQTGRREASTFWTGCGAVTREAFDAAGGFSPALSRMGMEDIDLGYRMRDAGFRILLIKDMLGTHLKAWTPASMVHTDIFHRGVPWMLLLLARDGAPPDLNLDARSRWCTVAGGVLPAALVLSLWWTPMLLIAALALAVIAGFQWGFLRMVAELKSPGFALACIPALALFYCCAAVSIPIALLRHWTGRGLKGRLATPLQ